MGQYVVYMWLLGVIVIVGMAAKKTPAPAPLILVITGMVLSFAPHFSDIRLHPDIVMNIFLPLLVYEASVYLSWPDIKQNLQPIILLSIGHVVFITILVAIAAHALIPGLSWPLALVLGSVISPPDDVAIISIAEKIQIPQKIVTILSGEGLLNDATALIIFRFSLAAALTNEFSAVDAISDFFTVIALESLYGIVLGNILGKIKLQLLDPKIHVLLSILSPFLAYLPAVKLGGCGVIATVVTGFVVSHHYQERFSPEVRLLSRAIWETLGYGLSSVLFLLVGLHFQITLDKIALIPFKQLWLYATVITLIVILGRFAWVFPTTYLPRLLFPSLVKNNLPPWQFPFIVSWSGMRGGISLAAALSVPYLATHIGDTDLRYLIIFLVFCVITATLLLQGISLPWLLEIIGASHIRSREKGDEHLCEFIARSEMTNAVLRWLTDYKAQLKEDRNTLHEVNLQLLEYRALKKRLEEIIHHDDADYHLRKTSKYNAAMFVFAQIIEVERTALIQLWRDGKVTFKIKNKLLEQLDLRSKRYAQSV
ncbi:Sodium, potassium, lithium and rubidium/H(+) antiporter [Aquicella siphonis]|uniref:Sodium, potassium, lithium and rubidium/H(+) antiporter n=1 Tax=Aquicella siphonis TaxID=254247 RepID=A0A5E4PKI9_9COXI|nr:sodium:proton antiporter [Aquicella siphonis]VVC77058.1 Sodium, potassium, lithium and rubidium/H(+) antiporter [Aquicella siphonis]